MHCKHIIIYIANVSSLMAMYASRVHAYNEELNQMWQESSFNLTTNHMENRK